MAACSLLGSHWAQALGKQRAAPAELPGEECSPQSFQQRKEEAELASIARISSLKDHLFQIPVCKVSSFLQKVMAEQSLITNRYFQVLYVCIMYCINIPYETLQGEFCCVNSMQLEITRSHSESSAL